MDVLTLPCMRNRHDSCAGGVTLGMVRTRTEHECFCTCHVVSMAKAPSARALHPAGRGLRSILPE